MRTLIHTAMGAHNQIVLACNEDQNFFVVYRCVNQVSSYNTYYKNDIPEKAHVNSIHLRSNASSFVENMCRRLQPLHDTSSQLSFPTTASNNTTTMGRDNDMPYFTCGQALFNGLVFDLFHHVQTGFSVNNRNYTMLLHGIENRWDCLNTLEIKDSLRFSRNSSFPPLKTASTYQEIGKKVVCQNQIYQNSFAVNTQRQTDTSLVSTSKELLGRVLEFAVVDVSLNCICVDWEIKLRRNLSVVEKCHILVFHEVARKICMGNCSGFQEICSSFIPLQYDDTYRRNIFGNGRCKRNNPEMVHVFPHLPYCLRKAVLNRWKDEGKAICIRYILVNYPDWKHLKTDVESFVPNSLYKWTNDDILRVAEHTCRKIT